MTAILSHTHTHTHESMVLMYKLIVRQADRTLERDACTKAAQGSFDVLEVRNGHHTPVLIHHHWEGGTDAPVGELGQVWQLLPTPRQENVRLLKLPYKKLPFGCTSASLVSLATCQVISQVFSHSIGWLISIFVETFLLATFETLQTMMSPPLPAGLLTGTSRVL